MFVERLNYEQKKDFAKKICKSLGETVYRFSVEENYLDNEAYLEIFVYDSELGNYGICIFDTYVCCNYKPYIKEPKKISNICFKELYKIFGEEYKDYYMQQVNQIFE